MADSIREQLLTAAVAALNDTGKPAGLTVHRHRTLPLEFDDLPATVLYLVDEQLPADAQQRVRRQVVRRTCTIALEHRVQLADEAQTIDQALDPLVSWGVQALVGSAAIAALKATVLEVGTKWRASDDDASRGAATTFLTLEYFTAAADPTARS